MMGYPIGIDLGTTNSVASVWRRGTLEAIPIDGRTIMPSVVSIRADGTVLIGQTAKARAISEPANSVVSAKRVIGDGKTTWEILGHTYNPIDISALILRRLRDAATAHIGSQVTEAVITVPAYFNNNQKRDTKLAGEAAGFSVLQLLPEPTAAAISYGLDKGKDQTILVYDLGGGTFDVSVLKVEGNKFQVLAVDGDFQLGGDDFDLLLATYLTEKLSSRTRSDVKRDLLTMQRLKEAAERAKIELSESDETQITIPEIMGTSLDETISRDVFQTMVTPLIDRTIAKVRAVLLAAKLTANDIDRVILVGGSTRIPLVKQRIAEAVKEPWIADRVDEAVAQGAAIVAGYLSSPDVDDRLPIEFSNVTAFNLGVRASSGNDRDLFNILIPKNSAIPTVTSQEFTTYQRNQSSVEVAVFQGEKPHCADNTFIGGFHLAGIPPALAGDPRIQVDFSMDDSDLLTVRASCNHKRQELTLDVNMISSEEDLRPHAPQADIFFLIDTSGSMGREIEGVKKSCLTFAKQVIDAGVDCRLGLMDFDLPSSSSSYRWEIFDPKEPVDFTKAISVLRVGRLGGMGCYIGNANTVPVIDAFLKAFNDKNRLNIGILISDEVGNDANATKQILNLLQTSGICLHVVGVKSSCHEQLAKSTGGQFWNIFDSRGQIDFSILLSAIATEITSLALR